MCGKKKNKVIAKELSSGMTPSGSLTAVHTSAGDELKGIRTETNIISQSVDHDGDNLKESTIVRKKIPKNQSALERNAVRRFLPNFNKAHNSNFKINNEILEKADIKDVLIEDHGTSKIIGIQVTISDAAAIEKLGKTGTHSRQGITYDIFSKSIKAAIDKKGIQKYDDTERSKTILVLDGWYSATPQALQRFATDEQAFLKNQGYREIWFAGTIDKNVIRLH